MPRLEFKLIELGVDRREFGGKTITGILPVILPLLQLQLLQAELQCQLLFSRFGVEPLQPWLAWFAQGKFLAG